MKPILLALTALLALAPAHAASKKTPKNPALAETWSADLKEYEGKKVTTYAIAVGDTGTISSEAEYAVVAVTTGTSSGTPGAEIPVLVATDKVQKFIASLAPKSNGKTGSFGAKITYAPLTATFVTIQGEPALIVGEVTAAAKKTKPSALSAAQHPPATTATGLFGKRPGELTLVPEDAPKKPVR